MRKPGTISISYNVIFIELLILILPFLTPKIQVFDTAVSRIFILVTLLITLLYVLQNQIIINGHLLPVWIYFIIASGIMLYHGDFKHILFIVVDQVGMLFLGYYYASNNKDVYRLFKLLVFPAAILGGVGIFESVFDINIFDVIFGFETIRYAANGYRLGLARAYASFSTSINFCLYLGMIQILSLYAAYNEKNKNNRITYAICFIILTMAMLFTFSRGALLATILFDAVMMRKQGAFKRTSTYAMILFWIGVFFALLLINNVSVADAFYILEAIFGVIIDQSRFGNLAKKYGYGSKHQSIMLIGWVLAKIRSKPFFGVGMKKIFSVNVNQFVKKTSIENEYLYVLYTTGWIGLINRLSYYYMLIRGVRKNVNSQIITYSYVVLMVFLQYLLSLTTVSAQDESRLLFFIVGTGLAYSMASRAEENNVYEKDRINGTGI